MNIAKPLLLAVALASLSLPACSGTAGEEEEPVGAAEQAQLGLTCHGALQSNALQSNALQSNALLSNALQSNALLSNALQSNALQSNALLSNALTDPNAREVLKYVVSCALTENQSVDVTVNGTPYSFPGSLGLAPEWGNTHGRCDKDCQEWVSACVIARLDFLGQHEIISLRGQDPALAVCLPELLVYNRREATYYGNVFVQPQQIYGCLAPGKNQIPRVCGPSLTGCAVDVEAHCDDVCGPPSIDGAFRNCRAHDGDADDKPYHGSITVFLKP